MTHTDTDPNFDPTDDAQTHANTQNNRGPKLTILIHDGNGTWFSPSSLRLIPLDDDELAELESGDESILNKYIGWELTPLLRPNFPDSDDALWD